MKLRSTLLVVVAALVMAAAHSVRAATLDHDSSATIAQAQPDEPSISRTNPDQPKIGLDNLGFLRVSPINPAWSAVVSCVVAGGLILRHRAVIRR